MISLIASADDPTSSEVEGFRQGAHLRFRMWDHRQQIETYPLETTFLNEDGSRADGVIFSPQETAIVTLHRTESQILPENTSLHANYPNPFNATTMLRYQLAEPTYVSLVIYNALGQHVKTLTDNQYQAAGHYIIEWNGTDREGIPVTSGLYLYKLSATGSDGSSLNQVNKMVLLN